MHENTGAPINILIVDDDKIIADIFKEMISDQSRTIEICHDGLDAVEKIKETVFDLIIVDLVMPGMGGLEVLKYAKQINPEMIVIIVTGYASLETAISAIKAGAYDYIRKPCKLEEMSIVVNRATEKIRLNRENKELLFKLQQANRKPIIMNAEKEKDDIEIMESVPFFSSDTVALEYLLKNEASGDNYIDKLQSLTTLKDNGVLSDREFKRFKQHLLEMMRIKGSQNGSIHG